MTTDFAQRRKKKRKKIVSAVAMENHMRAKGEQVSRAATSPGLVAGLRLALFVALCVTTEGQRLPWIKVGAVFSINTNA